MVSTGASSMSPDARTPADYAGDLGHRERRWMQRQRAADVGARRAVGDA